MTEKIKIKLWLDEIKASEMCAVFNELAEMGILVEDQPKLELWNEGVIVEAELDSVQWNKDFEIADMANCLRAYKGVHMITRLDDGKDSHYMEITI